jgi:SAM-dependent methyltransferase
MDSWGNLVIQPKPPALEQAQQLSHIKYTAPLPYPPTTERTVTILESRGLILSGGTTGNRTWEAALHLGSFLASPAGEALVHGKRVIELGAGTGFLSLFCAKHLGARGVVATDREPFLIENMRACAQLNQGKRKLPFYPAVWDWGTPLEQTEEMASMTEGGRLKFDVALGADLVQSEPNRTHLLEIIDIDFFQIYDTDLVPLLISTVQDLFSNYGVGQFIIAATLRNEDTFRTFLDACEENTFTVEVVPFESTPAEEQSGFFHSTSIPIRTYRISRG